MKNLNVYEVLGFSSDGSSVKKVRGIGRTMIEGAWSVVLVEHLQMKSITVINPATGYKRTFNLNT